MFMELDTIIVVRCGFENNINRTNKISVAYNSLAKEYPIIQKRNTPLFKNEAIYIPILHSWRTKELQVIGTVILSGFQDEKRNSQRDLNSYYQNDGVNKLAKSSLLREIMDQFSFFTNLCIMDMNYRKKDENFRSMSNMSKNTFFILKVSMFKYDNDIRNSLKIIRSKLPKMFHYEDCAILVKDKIGKKNA